MAAAFALSVESRKNGSRIQPHGKPIISSTNRGLSREVVPTRDASVSSSSRICPFASGSGSRCNRDILLKPILQFAPRSSIFRHIPVDVATYRSLLLITEPIVASLTVGVGSKFNGIGSIRPFRHIFRPCVWTVGKMGDEPCPVSPVRRIDTASWKYIRLDAVTFSFQISAHLLEYQSLRPINDSENILAHDPAGTDFPNRSQHLRPEIAIVLRASSFACRTERLAGEASRENDDTVSPNREICRANIGVLFCMWEMVFENTAAKRIRVAIELVYEARPFGGKVEASDSAEERSVCRTTTHYCR